MSRQTTVRIAVLAGAAIGLLLVAGPVGAQQGWPINGSNWSFYGGRGGGSSSYSPSFSGSYSPSYYSGSVVPYGGYSYAAPPASYYDGAYVYRLAPSANYSYGAYSSTPDNVARIHLTVPADAEVWFESKVTKQRGETRYFESPPLAPGRQYVYEVKARWRDKDGKEVTRTRRLDVSANAEVSADFTRQ